MTLGCTLLSILLSVTITLAVNFAFGDAFPTMGLLIAIIAPAVITPLLSYQTFKLLAHLDDAERGLQILSTTDELTGAYNRRFFLKLAHLELERARRENGEFAIAIMDFDNFKLINDHYGHLTGDQALREVCRVCRENMRKSDIFARYGGDEFIFLFPHTNDAEARYCLERIMEKISTLSFESRGRVVSPRVSIGMYPFGPKIKSLDDMLEKADLTLYKAKQTGGNKVAW